MHLKDLQSFGKVNKMPQGFKACSAVFIEQGSGFCELAACDSNKILIIIFKLKIPLEKLLFWFVLS
tara:strand:+ start:18671 stop:18868 length:198 start_codon:yes stop_codon:yes gene_type:complete